MSPLPQKIYINSHPVSPGSPPDWRQSRPASDPSGLASAPRKDFNSHGPLPLDPLPLLRPQLPFRCYPLKNPPTDSFPSPASPSPCFSLSQYPLVPPLTHRQLSFSLRSFPLGYSTAPGTPVFLLKVRCRHFPVFIAISSSMTLWRSCALPPCPSRVMCLPFA